MFKTTSASSLLVLLLLLSVLACSNTTSLIDEEIFPQLSDREATTTTQRYNKVILKVHSDGLELHFNAKRAVDIDCTQFHLPADLNYKLAIRHLPDDIYVFTVTCFDSEGNPFASGKQEVEISRTNPTAIIIPLKHSNNDVKAGFEKNYALWHKHKIESYSIIFQRDCFCPRNLTLPARVEVEQSVDVQITRASYLDSGKPVPQEFLDSFLSIEGVFEAIEEAIKAKAEVIKVTYHPKYGYPMETSINPEINTSDDELHLTISELELFRDNEVEEAFKRNYNLWLKQNIKNYSVTFQLSCFCTPDITELVSIVVEGGQKTQVNYLKNGEPVPKEYFYIFSSITEVFKLISDAIEQKAEVIEVSYDPKFGFPRKLYIDHDSRIADEEVHINLSDFNENCRLDSCKPPNPNCQPYDFNSDEYRNYANTIELFMTKSIPSQVSACLRSTHSDTCIDYINIVQSINVSTITLIATNNTPPNVGCGDALTPYARFVKVDTSGLETGDYILRFLGTIRQEASTSFYYQASPDGDCKPYSYNSKEYQNAANTIELAILESFPIQVDACLRSTHLDTCTEFIDIVQSVNASTFTITLKAEERLPPDVACGDALTPYARSVRLDTADLETGKYTLVFIGTMGQEVSTTFDYQAGDMDF